MKPLFILLFSFIFGAPCKAQYFDTLTLHYDIGVSKLNHANEATLDSIIKNLNDKKLLIYGHADYLGTEDPNQLLSEQRAKTVMNYLVSKGFSQSQIMQCSGLGQINGKGGSDGNPESRRTDIFIIRQKTTVAQPPIAPKVTSIKTEDKIAKIDYKNIKVGDTINLENIQFVTGTTTITRASYPEVEKLYQIMLNHPTLKIRLEGHVCCCIYPDGYFIDTPHWVLSEERAGRIYKMLIKKGIPATRMAYIGFGRTHPILENEETIEQGQVNRRVEVRILEK